LLINGVGTGFLEIIEDLPDIDVMIVPLGGGNEAAAAIVTLRALRPEVEIIAVQAEKSPAAYESWKRKRIAAASNTTFAGGLATGTAYEVPFSVYRDELSDFVQLGEDEIYDGMAFYYTHNLVEGAGGATIMAALKIRQRLRGRKVILQMSGCNASPVEIREAFKRESASTGFLA
jgi:threonine dehydratase